MKVSFIIPVFILLFQFTGFAQKAPGYHEAVYEISIAPRAESPGNNYLKLLSVTDLKYVVKATDSMYSIEATQAVADDEHIHTSISGPQQTIYNINWDVILFDNAKTSFTRFYPVLFSKTGIDTLINNYRCNLFLSPKHDSIYLSMQLPYMINPFILNSKSIRGGVVKAVMADGTTYNLTSLRIRTGNPFEKNRFLVTAKIIEKKNIFFE